MFIITAKHEMIEWIIKQYFCSHGCHFDADEMLKALLNHSMCVFLFAILLKRIASQQCIIEKQLLVSHCIPFPKKFQNKHAAEHTSSKPTTATN
jgi:hypothetical protein